MGHLGGQSCENSVDERACILSPPTGIQCHHAYRSTDLDLGEIAAWAMPRFRGVMMPRFRGLNEGPGTG